MNITDIITDGHVKQVFATDDPDKVVIRFKDVSSAFRSIKQAVLKGKAACDNRISSMIFRRLTSEGIENHFIEELSETEQLCRKVRIIPLEVVVRNYAAGSMARRLAMKQGEKLSEPVFELLYNNENLMNPLINEDHAVVLGICSHEEIARMKEVALKVNSILVQMFSAAGIKLVDFKVEFGRCADGHIILSDEISPDTSRLWDAETDEVLDKDRFRYDLGGVVEAYEKVYKRLLAL